MKPTPPDVRSRKLGGYDGKTLKFDPGELKPVAFESRLSRISHLCLRKAWSAIVWHKNSSSGERKASPYLAPSGMAFFCHFVCVTGTVRKCRPWFWDLIADVRLTPMFQLAQVTRVKPGSLRSCSRTFCIPSVASRLLRSNHQDLPNAYAAAITSTFRVCSIGCGTSSIFCRYQTPDTIPDPIPGPDPGPFIRNCCAQRREGFSSAKRPSILLQSRPRPCAQDYLALRAMPVDAARQYDTLRAPICFRSFVIAPCTKLVKRRSNPAATSISAIRARITTRTASPPTLQPVKQLINGVLTVVYDGLAAHQYFAAGDPEDIRVYNPQRTFAPMVPAIRRPMTAYRS